MDPKQPNEKRNPQEPQFPGQQPQRTPNQKPQQDPERERREK